MNIVIYTLTDPRTGNVRYIGKTADLNNRLKCHLKDKKPSHKSNWIKSLKDLGLRPIIEAIEEVPEEEWQQTEIFYIEYFRHLGFKLVNSNSGGVGGGKMREDIREKLRQAHKRDPSRALKLIANSKSRIGRPLSPEHGAKIAFANSRRIISEATRAKLKAICRTK